MKYVLTKEQERFLDFTITVELYDAYNKGGRLKRILAEKEYNSLDQIYLNRLRFRYVKRFPKYKSTVH